MKTAVISRNAGGRPCHPTNSVRDDRIQNLLMARPSDSFRVLQYHDDKKMAVRSTAALERVAGHPKGRGQLENGEDGNKYILYCISAFPSCSPSMITVVNTSTVFFLLTTSP